jgi:anti-sigma regulatory factor (Ser/Thr protein kinase)
MDAKAMTPEALRIRNTADVVAARRLARETAIKTGFSKTASEEVALVVHELGTNIVRHAGTGLLRVAGLDSGSSPGLQISAQDEGPGIPDIDNAVRDGFSSAGSLGYGLGTVYRMMDSVDITSPLDRGRGTHIDCVRRLEKKPVFSRENPVDCGAATRPYPGMRLNGDAFVLKRSPRHTLAAVIDGLGHGTFAHRAAQTAKLHVEKFADHPLTDIFRNVERFCRATRGVVMAVARIEHQTGELCFAGIGNIAVRLSGATKNQSLYQLRGIVGANAPNAREITVKWPAEGVLVMHSDGLSSRWRWSEHRHLFSSSATEMAGAMLRSLTKENDDATIVVVKDRALHRMPAGVEP